MNQHYLFVAISLAVLRPGLCPAEVAAPPLNKDFVGSPEFTTKSGQFGAGTAFAVSVEGEPNPMIMTAAHLFGPAGGLEKQVPSAELPGFVKEITLQGMFLKKQVRTKARAIPIAPLDSKETELAVFRTSLGKSAAAQPLAGANPALNDTVWLVAHVRSGAAPGQYMFRGKIAEFDGDIVKCKFDNGELNCGGASGGPYVNEKGEVIGMHLFSQREPGSVTGCALSAEAIRAALARSGVKLATKKIAAVPSATPVPAR